MKKRATIVAFIGSWGSGIAHLLVLNDDNRLERVFCENAPTVRALNSMFPNAIAAGHRINNDAIRGRGIVYQTDDLGFLQFVAPAESLEGKEGDSHVVAS